MYPATYMTPTILAERAQSLSGECWPWIAKVLDLEQIRDLKWALSLRSRMAQ